MYEDLHLNRGERLLWSGEPVRHRLFEPSDFFVVPFTVAWFGFVIFTWTRAARDGAPLFFLVWISLFVAVGLYLVAGRFVLRAVRSRVTHYAVTDQRLIEKTGRPWAQTREAYLRDLPPPVVRVRDGDSIGSVAFGEFPGVWEAFDEMGLRSYWRARRPRPFVLRQIEQARYVRDLIANATARSGPH